MIKMNDPTIKQMYAKAIGDLALSYLEQQGLPTAEEVNSRAIALISQIQTVLNDENLDDPECFHRIEAIVELFHEAGLSTTRHDWG